MAGALQHDSDMPDCRRASSSFRSQARHHCAKGHAGAEFWRLRRHRSTDLCEQAASPQPDNRRRPPVWRMRAWLRAPISPQRALGRIASSRLRVRLPYRQPMTGARLSGGVNSVLAPREAGTGAEARTLNGVFRDGRLVLTRAS
jgi:hypothetical protein